MPLDAITLTALKNELSDALAGARIDRVQQPENDTLLLSMRGAEFSGRLLLCAGSGASRIHITNERFDNPSQPPMFCMLMRKHIEGARVLGISQPPMERLLDIELDAPDTLGDFHKKHLILELMGRYSNIILTDSDGVIIDCLRRIGSAAAEGRMVLPGLVYRLPEQAGKLDITSVPDGKLGEMLAAAEFEKTAEKALLDLFMGFSPLICREIVFRAYGETDTRMFEVMKRDMGRSLVRELSGFRDKVRSGDLAPYILRDKNGRPKDITCMRTGQYGDVMSCERLGSFSELLDEYYTKRDKAEKARQRSLALMKQAKTLRDRLRRKLETQKKELIKTYDRESLREQADIIMANLGQIQRGAAVLEAEDFYSGTGGKRIIKLDPAKSPQKNAAKYYKNYRKAKNASKILAEQIENGESELEYLDSVIEEIQRAETEKDISEIRCELEDAGYLRKPKQGKKVKRTEQKPMHFVSSTGYDIFVGRNNTQNDMLTLKKAFKSDVWLHTQKIHGSHAVISANGAVPDEKTIAEAASLAAYFSQARGSGKVPVDYTLVKYVKKPSGAKPGMVIYTDYKTVYAAPDEALVKSLGAK